MAVITKTRVGDRGWEVEWCSNLPVDEYGDCDRDAATFEHRDFTDRDEAIAYAKQVYPLDAFGSVAITPFVIEPLSDEWPFGKTREYTGDTEHYDGDE